MSAQDLREFIAQLEARGQLKRIRHSISPALEMTEIADRTLKAAGPALLFENPTGFTIPVLANLFGTPERVALGMGQNSVAALKEVGELLAFLKEPEPPKGLKDAWAKLPIFKLNDATARGYAPDEIVRNVDVPIDLLAALVDDDDCQFDHGGGCQAHGYLSLAPGEKCPQAELKEIVGLGDSE